MSPQLLGNIIYLVLFAVVGAVVVHLIWSRAEWRRKDHERHVASLYERLSEAHAVISKLERSGDDVPITPGMTLHCYLVVHPYSTMVTVQTVVAARDKRGELIEIPTQNYYTTQALAQANPAVSPPPVTGDDVRKMLDKS